MGHPCATFLGFGLSTMRADGLSVRERT